MTGIGCENLKSYVANFSLVSACDVVKNGALRFATPFTYPNGSHIDLFLYRKPGLFDEYVISDYGHTYNYLHDTGFNIWKTKVRRQIVTDICQNLGVFYVDNAFVAHIGESDLQGLSDYIVRLAQACIRITDLSYTQRTVNRDLFEAEVEEAIAATEVPYETDISFIGRLNAPVKISFVVKGKSTASLVQTLSSNDSYAFHALSNELFVRWDALRHFRPNYQFITVFDEQAPHTREDDLKRLYEVSTTLAFPSQRSQLLESIA